MPLYHIEHLSPDRLPTFNSAHICVSVIAKNAKTKFGCTDRSSWIQRAKFYIELDFRFDRRAIPYGQVITNNFVWILFTRFIFFFSFLWKDIQSITRCYLDVFRKNAKFVLYDSRVLCLKDVQALKNTYSLHCSMFQSKWYDDSQSNTRSVYDPCFKQIKINIGLFGKNNSLFISPSAPMVDVSYAWGT